jgi:copper chaperone CopZ
MNKPTLLLLALWLLLTPLMALAKEPAPLSTPLVTEATAADTDMDALTDGETVYVHVNGLVCDFCARALEKVFRKQDAVASIAVDLDEKIITVYFKDNMRLDDDTIISLIADSGYNVTEIEHGN